MNYCAASARGFSHKSRSRNARAASACLRSLPRKVPSIGGNRPKLTFIGWKVAASAPPVMWPSNAPMAVVGRGEAARQQPDSGAFDVSLAARDLAGEAQPRHDPEPKRTIEQARAVEEGVAVQATQPRELRALEAW